MEYNKKLFTKANDKKVLHKVKKQWIVLSMSLLAALGIKALATNSVNADTTPAVGSTTDQAKSSKPASVQLVNSQSNVNDNNQDKINSSAHNHQIATSSSNSNQIMKRADQVHSEMVNKAMHHNLSSTKPETLGASAPTLDQANHKLQNSNEQQGVQAVSVNKKQLGSSLNPDDQQGTSSLHFDFLNQSHVNIGSAVYTGKAHSTVSLSQILSDPNFTNNFPSDYQLNPSTYTTKNNQGFHYTFPSDGKTSNQSLYFLGNVQGGHHDNVFPINVIKFDADGHRYNFQVPYQLYNRIGDTTYTIKPYDLINTKLLNPKNSDYYPYVNDYSQYFGGKSSNYHQDPNEEPVTIPLNPDGSPNMKDAKPITFVYISNDAPSNVMNLSWVDARYYAKSDVEKHPDWKLNENFDKNVNGEINPVKDTSKDDHSLIGENYDAYGRRYDIPRSDYYYVKDLSTPPKKIPSDLTYFNIEIAKRTRINYYLVNSDGSKKFLSYQWVTPTPDSKAKNNDGYVYGPLINNICTKDKSGHYVQNYPGFTEMIEHNYTDDTGNKRSLANKDEDVKAIDPKYIPADGQTYNVDLYRNKYPITIKYVKYPQVDPKTPVNKLTSSDIVTTGQTIEGLFGTSQNIDNKGFLNKYNSDSIIQALEQGRKPTFKVPSDGWQIPSNYSYLDNPTYTFNEPNSQTFTVPVTLPNAKLTANIIYKDSDGHQVGNTYPVTGSVNGTTPVPYKEYEQSDKLPNGYTNPKVDIGKDAHKYVEYNGLNIIHVDRKGTIEIKYYTDDGQQALNSDTTKVFNGYNHERFYADPKNPSDSSNDQSHNPMKYIPSGYSFDKYLGYDNPLNTPEFNGGNQLIKVNLVKNVTGHIYYYDVDNNNEIKHLSDVTGKPKTDINDEYHKFANLATLNTDLPGYHFANPNYAKVNPGWQLENADYYIPVTNVAQGVIYVNYYVVGNNKSVGQMTTAQPIGVDFYPQHAASENLSNPKVVPKAYQHYEIKAVKMGNYNAPKDIKYINTPQTINVYLDVPRVNGRVTYIDITNGGRKPINNKPISNAPVGSNVKLSDYDHYEPDEIPSGYIFLKKDNPNNILGTLAKNQSNDYTVNVEEVGKINVYYVIDKKTDPQHILSPYNQSAIGAVNTGFDWSKYTDSIPSGYRYVEVLPNNVDSFGKNTQNVYIDVAKGSTAPSNGSAVIEYRDINDPNESVVSSTGIASGTYDSVIPNSDYHTPSGYDVVKPDPNNTNRLDNTTDIIWVKKIPQPTPQPTSQSSYAPAPSSASSMPSASASSASSAPSQSSVAPSSSVTPPSSKSVAPQRKSAAPQRKSTRPAHQTKRGNIGVTYEEPNGNVITDRNYNGKVGQSFAPTAPSGYHYVVVKGKNVKQFKDHRQHVILKLVKSDYYGISHHKTPASSANRRNGRTDRDLKMYSGSNRASFDHALDQEANIARNQANGKKLPQTGESQSNYVEVIGAALLMISAVFVAGYDFDMKRRRD